MIDWFNELSARNLLFAVLVFLFTSAASAILLGFVFVRIPADYFSNPAAQRPQAGNRSWVYWTTRIIKNILGAAIILLGCLMAVPGVPGPGLPIALIGVMLMDFPAMRRLERWLISRNGVLSTINLLRERYGKPPLVLESDPRVKQEAPG
jgi:hypothetical protein